MKSTLLSIIVTILLSLNGFAQVKQMNSGEIYKALEKFNFLGSALYVAAHPDDENTRLISYLSNDVNAHTTYLSLTRGDGGQNLIGPEISELLGVIRTQELLAARRIDGGHQRFTRANDFGYSKSPKEAINIWDDEKVKHDVVLAIRTLRPDIIINRFDHSGNRRTHGHHTASAMLSDELFEKAGDPSIFPEQLKTLSPWKASRLFFNTSWWFYGSREKFKEADKSKMCAVDIGSYYPLLGKSNNEIAALSRSQHKCQGFGSTGKRGSQLEYLQLVRGSMPNERSNLFEGINTTWTRVTGGDIIQRQMDLVLSEFDFKRPEKSIDRLMTVYQHIQNLDDPFWRNRKTKELETIIQQCLGLYLEANIQQSTATPGEKVIISIEATQRRGTNISLRSIQISPQGLDTVLNHPLELNQAYFQDIPFEISNNAEFTSPYWLKEQGSLGMYKVDDANLIGLPETPRTIQVNFILSINNIDITIAKDATYKYNSPENGETIEPFDILPEAFVSLEDKVYVFSDNQSKKIKLKVVSGKDSIDGKVYLNLKEGWQSDPLSYDFILNQKGESKTFDFSIIPPSYASSITVSPIAEIEGEKYDRSLSTIDYDHIPLQRVLLKAQSKCVNLDIKKAGKEIAYIKGAGDAIPESIRQIGYDVTELDLEEIDEGSLRKYDALIIGIRAYNTLDQIRFHQKDFLKYVENGGTMIVQYNTNRSLKIDNIGPYPIKLSRDRVSVEEAEIRVLNPDHRVMNFPNQITSEDFENWVQERGLYFANEWDDAYKAIWSANDPGEDPKNGGLLIAEYGNGHFVYTGYSWFRQLPAGVPGAYRIFANLLSLSNFPRP